MRILVTRPAEDGAQIAALLAARGHQVLLAPLLTPHYLDGPEPAFHDLQAILASSANGVRALVRRTARRDLPLFAVGPQTAAEALREGFSDVRNADGDARDLARAAASWASPDKGALLHVCGEEAPGTLAENLAAQGFSVRRLVLYRVDAATQLPPEASTALKDGAVDGALFFSPRSARLFGSLAREFDLSGLIAFCISPVTADGLPPGFAEVRVAARPNQAALLALVE